MSTGVDLKRFARRLKELGPEERRRFTSRYVAWIFEGARAQGWYRAGLLLLGASLLVALDATILGLRPLWIYLLCAMGALVGAWLTSIAFRREHDWRRAHPFEIGGDDAKVR